jgi:hypothetical protein
MMDHIFSAHICMTIQSQLYHRSIIVSHRPDRATVWPLRITRCPGFIIARTYASHRVLGHARCSKQAKQSHRAPPPVQVKRETERRATRARAAVRHQSSPVAHMARRRLGQLSSDRVPSRARHHAISRSRCWCWLADS